MIHNQFGKKIILFNKKKIYSSANSICNKFLRKIIVMNIIFLWKCQEAVSHATKVTLYGNQHNFIIKLLDIL